MLPVAHAQRWQGAHIMSTDSSHILPLLALSVAAHNT